MHHNILSYQVLNIIYNIKKSEIATLNDNIKVNTHKQKSIFILDQSVNVIDWYNININFVYGYLLWI